MACEADLSELEQQQESLVGAVPDRGDGRAMRRGVMAAVGTALLGAAVLAVLFARPSATVGAPGAAEREMSNLIQSYALEKHGRPLTSKELTAVEANLAKTGYGHLARPRGLQEDDANLPAGCEERLRDLAREVIGRVMLYTMQAVSACEQDPFSETCKNKTQLVNTVEDEYTAACKLTGDICTITSTLEDGQVMEEKDICMPKACHSDADHANAWAEANLRPEKGEKGMCGGCTSTVTCGEGEGQEAESTQPDMQFFGNAEKDGAVHPKAEIWKQGHSETTPFATAPPIAVPLAPTLAPIVVPLAPTLAPIAPPLAPTLAPIATLPPLEIQTFPAAVLPTMKPLSLEDKLPSQCTERLRDIARDVIGKVMQATMKAISTCEQNGTSTECQELTAKVNTIEDEYTAGCKLSGDICTLTEKVKDGEVLQEKDICMPKACQADPASANKWAEENLRASPKEMLDGASQTFVCGDGGTGDAEAATPDTKFSDKTETDGEVHPEVEVWNG